MRRVCASFIHVNDGVYTMHLFHCFAQRVRDISNIPIVWDDDPNTQPTRELGDEIENPDCKIRTAKPSGRRIQKSIEQVQTVGDLLTLLSKKWKKPDEVPCDQNELNELVGKVAVAAYCDQGDPDIGADEVEFLLRYAALTSGDSIEYLSEAFGIYVVDSICVPKTQK